MTEVNLKNFAMQQGITKLYKDMTEAERVQLRYNFVLSKTAFLQGDAKRTIESTANQIKVFKTNMTNLYATLGKELDPAFNEFLKNINENLETLSENKEFIKGLATIFLGLSKTVGFLAGNLKKAIDEFIRFTTFGTSKNIQEWVSNFSGLLNLLGVKVEDTGEKLEDLNTSTATTLNESSEQFETWGGNLQEVFKGISSDSEKMKIETAKNILAMLEAFQTMSKKMPKATALGTITKLAKLEGKSNAEIKEIKKPIEEVWGMNDKELTSLIKDMKEYVKGGGTDEGWSKFAGRNIGSGANSLTLGKLKSNYQAELKAFEEYAKQRQLTEEEKLQGLLSIQDSYTKQAIDNKWLEYGKTLSIQANETQNKIKKNEEEKKSLDELNKSYEEAPEKIQAKIQAEKDYYLKQQEMQDDVFKTLSEATTQEELQTSFETLFGKYSSQGKIIEYLNSLYPDFLNNLGKQKTSISDISNVFSETSKITGELATLFEDDLLGAMSSLIGASGNFATSLMSGNVLGSISSGLALVNQLDSFLNDSDIGEKQEEANNKFQEAVESFKKSVENFSLGQKISFAKLEKPSNLVGAITGTGEKGTQLWEHMLTGGGASILDLLKGDFKATNASLDTTALQQQLASAGYSGIDVNAIFGKYAQIDSYRNWYGKKESYISGYDTAGAMAEITKLIEEAWQANLEGFAQALSLTSQDFISNMVDVFKSGGSISESVNDMFYNAVIEAFFNQELFETLNKNLSGAISEIIIGELSTEGIDLGMDFKGMSPGEMIEAYTKIYGASSDKLKEILEQLGLAASSATDQLNQVSTKNLPSGLKVASAEFQATNASYGQTYQTIYQIENNYSKDFSEMVATAQNQSRFNQTGNARRGY